MSTAKKEVKKLLGLLPERASYEDIQYHIYVRLYVRQKIERGLKDIREDRMLSQKEVERRMAKWLGK